jgi:dUTP pyrophosphatase
MRTTRIRDFEKVSYTQFIKDCIKCGIEYPQTIMEGIYDDIQLPRRATLKSSGYDFISPFSFSLKPNETKKFPLGIKSYMQNDETLLIFPRSSVGFKYKIKIDNTVGIIDQDFYNNQDNEGNIHISITNTGDKVWEVQAGDRICQGIFIKYFTTDSDFPISENRVGGNGSSGR